MVESDAPRPPLKVETLIVMATNRGQFIAFDQVEALHYSHSLSHHIVIIDGGKSVPVPRLQTGFDVIPCTIKPEVKLSGFMCYEGITWAIQQGIEFERVLVLDDDALPIGWDLDVWARNVMVRGNIDLLGVTDRVNYQAYWDNFRRMVTDWCAPEDPKFFPSAETIFFAANWMSKRFVMELHSRNLLRPFALERWTLYPDVYISWMAQILGMTCYGAGSMEHPRPPLYLNHPRNHQRWAPDPRILHPDFKLYHSVRSSTEAELDIREYYREFRRETGQAAAIQQALSRGVGQGEATD